MRLVIVSLLFLSGCADLNTMTSPAPQPKVVFRTSTFCEMTSKIDPATGKKVFVLTWDKADTVETADGVERLGVKYTAVCEKRSKPTS